MQSLIFYLPPTILPTGEEKKGPLGQKSLKEKRRGNEGAEEGAILLRSLEFLRRKGFRQSGFLLHSMNPVEVFGEGIRLRRFYEYFSSFSSGRSNIPWWCDRDILVSSEEEVVDARDFFSKTSCLMRYTWGLAVGSKSAAKSWISFLEDSLNRSIPPLQTREKLYLLAVTYYKSEDYERSRQALERCLEIAPDWRPALTLMKVVEDQISKDGVFGIKITTIAMGLVLCGIATVIARKR